VEHLDLHRVSDPRFVAVDVPVKPPRGRRRMICPVDSTIEELSARHVLEDAQRERILAGFEAENAWRIEHRGAGEPLVTFGPGVRGDIEARAGFNWRPSSTSTKAPPDSALVHVLLDATGADEAYLHWLLDDGDCNFVYLVTPPETAPHLPEEIEHAGRKVQIRRFPWIRDPASGGFDPLATDVWFQLAGPNIALRAPVVAPTKITLVKKPTKTPKKRGS
jgi:hypothetical protein